MNVYKKRTRKTNYKRYTNKRRGRAQMQMVTWPGSKPVLRKYEIDIPIYIYTPGGLSAGYSFLTSGVGHTYHVNAFTPSSDVEVQDYLNQHTHYKVHGCEMKFVRSLNAAISTVYQLPEMAFCLTPYLSSSQLLFIDKTAATNNDGAYRVQPLNSESNPKSKYFRFGASAFGNSSVISGGNALIPTNITANYNLIMGYDQNPTNSSSTDSPMVGSIKLTWYLSFHNPLRINNY